MTKIYSVTHKEYDKYASERTIIGVGTNKNISNVELYDNTLDNISEKNDKYCELTALYWVWKNTDDEIIGLEHYRRFFSKENLFKFRPISINECEKILRKYDIILPKPSKISKLKKLYDGLGILHNMKTNRDCTVYCEYKNCKELDKAKEIISDVYPAYIKAFEKVMCDNKMYLCNMFVAKKDLIDKYCEWLFNILFEYERCAKQSGIEVRPRMYGFLSERLFNVWIKHNGLKTYNLPVRNFETMPKYKRILSKIFKVK